MNRSGSVEIRAPWSPGGALQHTATIGQAHHMLWFERLIEYISSKDGVWFATCAEICDAWVDDDEDRRLMEMEDVRGVEQAPVGSGFR
jgi:hypothetical protein